VRHEVGGVTVVEYPTKCFCEHVRRIPDSRKVNQDDVLHESPMLKCKTSDFHMTRAICGSTVIDNLDRGIVGFVDGCRLSLSVTQFVKNELQMFSDFGGSIGCDEFRFCGALRANGLCARTTSHDTTGQTTSAPRGRPTLTQFVSMGCVDVSNQLSKMGRRRNEGCCYH